MTGVAAGATPPACCGAARSSSCSDSKVTSAWARIILSAFIAGHQMVIALAVNLSETRVPERALLHAGLAVTTALVVLLLGGGWLRGMRDALRARRTTIEVLFGLGMAGALGLSLRASVLGTGAVYYEVISVLLVAYALGRLVRRSAQARVREAAQPWSAGTTDCLVLRSDGTTERRVVATIRVGERIRVGPGQRVPVDGVVEEGTARVRTGELTGEPFAVPHGPGAHVLATGHVLDATLVVRATAPGDDRQIDRIVDVVKAATVRPSRHQTEAERLMRWFLPVVASTAVLTMLGWSVMGGLDAGVFAGLAVLLVACPCALGFATPIAVFVALSRLARSGLVARGADILERWASVDVVVFDKTGTLSDPEPRLVSLDPVPDSPWSAAALRDLVALAEQGSPHPLARAFGTAAHGTHLGMRVLPGRGIESRVGYAGRVHSVRVEQTAGCGERSEHGLDVTVDGQHAGIAWVDETLWAERFECFDRLRALGLEVRVLSGDRGSRVARVGGDSAHGGVSAEEKAAEVRALVEAGRRVLFVGDGLNDAAAMAEATVAVAVSAGAPLATATAEVVWHGKDPRAVAAATALCRQTVRHIRSNLRYAVTYNVLGMLAAVAGFVGPVLAAVLMTASSLMVTARAARLAE